MLDIGERVELDNSYRGEPASIGLPAELLDDGSLESQWDQYRRKDIV